MNSSRTPPRFPALGSLLFALGLLLFSPPVWAHRLHEAALSLEVRSGQLQGHLEVPLRDLANAIPLDRNEDQNITWAEVRAAAEPLEELVRKSLQIHCDQAALRLAFAAPQVSDVAGEVSAYLAFTAEASPAAGTLRITYQLLFDVDPEHRGLLRLSVEDRVSSHVFTPERTELFVQLREPVAPPSFIHFVREGVHHIAIGIDHLLFVVALLLPAVLERRRGAKENDPAGAARFRPVLRQVVQVITAFTLAHSLTLALASFDLVRLPARLVEPVIAASVALAAVNNLVPCFRERSWLVAFGFGLIHGFGFASVLADLRLPAGALAGGLLGFNLGVELGQLTLVAALLPLAFLARHTWFYRRVALQFGSALIALLALGWVVERTTDTTWMPF